MCAIHPNSFSSLLSFAECAVPFWIMIQMMIKMMDDSDSSVSIHAIAKKITPNVAFVCLEAVELRHCVSTCSLSEITTEP